MEEAIIPEIVHLAEECGNFAIRGYVRFMWLGDYIVGIVEWRMSNVVDSVDCVISMFIFPSGCLD